MLRWKRKPHRTVYLIIFGLVFDVVASYPAFALIGRPDPDEVLIIMFGPYVGLFSAFFISLFDDNRDRRRFAIAVFVVLATPVFSACQTMLESPRPQSFVLMLFVSRLPIDFVAITIAAVVLDQFGARLWQRVRTFDDCHE